MNCADSKIAIPLFLYNELSFDEEERLEQHLAGCEACREELVQEQRLHQALGDTEPQAPPDLLWQCRRELLAKITSPARTQQSFLQRLQESVSFRLHLPSVAQPFGALALIAIGFFGARFVPAGSLGGFVSAGLADPIASRVRYLEPDPSGRIRIVVEETRQKTFSGSLSDERIQRLVLAAAQDPSDPGLRVESMDLLKSRPEMEEVHNALLAALQHDTNAGVRLKALEGLKGSVASPEVQRVLSSVLLTDENPGVRTQVVDLLIQQNERQRMVGVLQELMSKENNGYIRMRCQKALIDMKASDTF